MKFLASLMILVASMAAQAAVIDKTVTVSFSADAPDQVSWQGVSLESGTAQVDPRFEAPSWELRLRQGYVSTNGGSVAMFETDNFDSIAAAPAEADKYKADSKYDPMGPAPEDTYNKNLMEWYEYFMLQGHLLAPKPFVFVVKTSDGRYAKVQFTDYVKDGYAIRVVGQGIFGAKKKKTKVGAQDGKVHVTLRYKINTVVGDRNF